MRHTMRCSNCGEIFHESEIHYEDQLMGEYLGRPAYERWACCPYCYDTDIEDYYEDEEDEEDV